MPAGLEVYRQNGTVKFSLNSRPYNFLGVFETGKSNGSVALYNLTPGGNLNWFEKPLASFNDRIPTITRSGNSLVWTFANSGASSNVSMRVYWGEW